MYYNVSVFYCNYNIFLSYLYFIIKIIVLEILFLYLIDIIISINTVHSMY